ncbi:MAG: hypothetical protein JSW52_01840 [Candidatus Coatesbacteria bacterium]|nr:MAG: hypothetical protein JSW52_01840 [Candidatus Coatesbacteria bacterium]
MRYHPTRELSNGLMLRWIEILYYRLYATGAAFRESARDAYVAHAVKSLAFRVLFTAEGFTAISSEAGRITLEFVVRIPVRRFPGADDRYFVEALFARSAVSVRLDGRPADVAAVELERAGRDRRDNFWSVSITPGAPGPPPTEGTEVVIEAGTAAATFVLGPPATAPEDARAFEVPGVREFVTRLKPGDFDDRENTQ